MTDIIDIKLTTDQDLELDETKDIATVTGEERRRQSAAMHVLDEAHGFVGSPITPVDISRLKASIRDALSNDPEVEQVLKVEVEEIDRAENDVKLRVFLTDDEDFEITV